MIDLFSITENSLQGLSGNIELVDVEIISAGILRVTIDKVGGINIDDCEQVSRYLTHIFAVENVNYKNLEVSSPGIDRPLRKISDFIRFVGERVEIKFHNVFNGRKLFKGTLFLKNTSAFNKNEIIKVDSHDMMFGIKIDSSNDINDPETIEFFLTDIDHAKLDPILDFKGKGR